jgi:hypothetical protein
MASKPKPIKVTSFAALAAAFNQGAVQPNAPGTPVTDSVPAAPPSTLTDPAPQNGDRRLHS